MSAPNSVIYFFGTPDRPLVPAEGIAALSRFGFQFHNRLAAAPTETRGRTRWWGDRAETELRLPRLASLRRHLRNGESFQVYSGCKGLRTTHRFDMQSWNPHVHFSWWSKGFDELEAKDRALFDEGLLAFASESQASYALMLPQGAEDDMEERFFDINGERVLDRWEQHGWCEWEGAYDLHIGAVWVDALLPRPHGLEGVDPVDVGYGFVSYEVSSRSYRDAPACRCKGFPSLRRNRKRPLRPADARRLDGSLRRVKPRSPSPASLRDDFLSLWGGLDVPPTKR